LAAALHAKAWPDPLVATVWLLEVDRPALVLGSTQGPESVDGRRLEAMGIDLVRRRSGGGAVLLEPGRSVWVDVFIPRHDPRWDDDVHRSFLWLGEAWVAALDELGLAAEVHRGGLERTAWSDQVCFAAVGTGEVTLDGAKAVGLSQRRTRGGARLQCVVYRSWDASPLGALIGVDPALLPPVATVDRPEAAIRAALVRALPSG
jgi:lipoate-protein ligase A